MGMGFSLLAENAISLVYKVEDGRRNWLFVLDRVRIDD